VSLIRDQPTCLKDRADGKSTFLLKRRYSSVNPNTDALWKPPMSRLVTEVTSLLEHLRMNVIKNSPDLRLLVHDTKLFNRVCELVQMSSKFFTLLQVSENALLVPMPRFPLPITSKGNCFRLKCKTLP
jgi:hypothetical protein